MSDGRVRGVGEKESSYRQKKKPSNPQNGPVPRSSPTPPPRRGTGGTPADTVMPGFRLPFDGRRGGGDRKHSSGRTRTAGRAGPASGSGAAGPTPWSPSSSGLGTGRTRSPSRRPPSPGTWGDAPLPQPALDSTASINSAELDFSVTVAAERGESDESRRRPSRVPPTRAVLAEGPVRQRPQEQRGDGVIGGTGRGATPSR